MNTKIFFAVAIILIIIISGCNTKKSTQEQLICVPASNISELCKNSGYDPLLDSLNEAEKQINDSSDKDTSEIIRSIDDATNALSNITPVKQEEIPDYTINEGELLKVTEKAVDPDKDPVTYKYPSPLDSKGEWQTGYGDAGTYHFNIIASDGKLTTSKTITVLVKKAENLPPNLNNIKDITLYEGEKVVIPKITDPENDNVSVTISNPVGNDGVWETSYSDEGVYKISITASDGKLKTTKIITLTVKNMNRKPSITSITADPVHEGELLKVKVLATDPDNDNIRTLYSKPLNSAGEWQTASGNAGEYPVNITISDGYVSEIKTITLTVTKANSPPIISGVSDMSATETETVKITPVVTDADNDKITVTISDPVGNDGEWVTDYNSAGTYSIIISANDGKLTTSKTIILTVKNKDRPPVFV